MKSKGKNADRQIRTLARQAKSKKKKEMSEALKAIAFVSTGFVVGQIGDELVILTAAHSLDHIFTASIPITAEQFNDLFNIEVLCPHYEEGYKQAKSKGEREYGMARVLSVNCEKDLLLLAVMRTALKTFAGAPCEEEHAAFQLCATIDDPTEKCLVVSWPDYKLNTVAVGRIGVSRRIEEISEPNSNEYNMKLLEVYMKCESGSSGAPLVNKSGQAIGVLHGNHEAHSYIICARHVISFLTRSLGSDNFPQPALGTEASTSSKRPRAN